MKQKAGQGDESHFILSEKCENYLLDSQLILSHESALLSDSGWLPIHF